MSDTGMIDDGALSGRVTGLTPTVAPEGLRLPAPEQPGPSLGDIGSAAFGPTTSNTVLNALRFVSREPFKPDPNYDLMEDPAFLHTQYQDLYQDNFVGSVSADDTRARIARIEKENHDREIMSAAGWKGMVAQIAAGIVDPTILVPAAGWLTAGRAAVEGGRVAIAAGEAALGAAAAVGIQEGVAQATQETRTASESAWAIGGAAVLGGILGGGLSALSRREVADLARRVGEDVNPPANTSPASAGAAATDASRGSGELAGSFGAAEALRKLNPSLRTQTSPFRATRNTVRDLIAGDPLKENQSGIVSSEGGSVEAQVNVAHGPMIDVWERYRNLYSDYFFGKKVPFAPAMSGLTRLAGRGRGRMSYAEFQRAVADAALDGDVHPIPQVEAAAKYRTENLINPLRDAGMDAIPGFREMVEAGSADPGYLTRIWNRVAVAAARNELRDVLIEHFAVQQERAVADTGTKMGAAAKASGPLSRQELESLADDVIDTILGQSPGRIALPNEFNVGPRGPLKERALRSLPTKAVLKFVERDAEVIDRFYTRSMATDIALTKKFGSIDMTEQIAKITDEANAAVKAAGKDEAKAKRINKEKESDIRDLLAMRDIIRGTYKLPDNPTGLLHRSVVVGKTLNYLSSLGLMTVSSISDVGKLVFRNGLMRTMKTTFQPLTHGLGAIKLARKDAKLAYAGTDMIGNDRMMSFAELVDDYGRGSTFERGVAGAGRAFSVATLMAPWNAFFRQLGGIISQTRALQAIEKLATGGKLAKKETAFLAENGVDNRLADLIHGFVQKHGGKDGEVWWANTKDWGNTPQAREAKQALRTLVSREADRMVIVPGAGDKPLVMHGDLGSVIGQFQSFAISSIQRTLLSGLQQRDMAVLNGTILMLGLGALSYYLKAKINGQDVSKVPMSVWAAEAVDNSGVLGVLMNADHALEKLTGDRLGVAALTGQPARRYTNVSTLGAFLGPSVGKVSDAFDIIKSASNVGKQQADGTAHEFSQSDLHKLRRMMPLQNLFWFRKAFDAMESGTANAFGIPMKQRN